MRLVATHARVQAHRTNNLLPFYTISLICRLQIVLVSRIVAMGTIGS
jgi:hypothetical protein